METARIIDKLRNRIPFYDRLFGVYDDEAILGHAAAKYPATLTDIIAGEMIESGEIGPEFLGGLWNGIKKVAGGVIKTGMSLIGGVAQKHQIQIQPVQTAPTTAQMQMMAAAAKSKEGKGLSTVAIIGMAIGGVVLALIVFLIASK